MLFSVLSVLQVSPNLLLSISKDSSNVCSCNCYHPSSLTRVGLTVHSFLSKYAECSSMHLCSPVAGSLQTADLVPQMVEKQFEPCSKPHLGYIPSFLQTKVHCYIHCWHLCVWVGVYVFCVYLAH